MQNQQTAPPTEEVIRMIKQGLSNEEIITALQGKGYPNTMIAEALNQANTKVSIEGEAPQPSVRDTMKRSILDQTSGEDQQNEPQYEPQQVTSGGFAPRENERFEELAESIVAEKWKKMLDSVGDLGMWKEKVKTDILSLKQEILRMQSRFEALENAMVGKVHEYKQSIDDVGANVRALEKVLQNILEPLTTSVKELKKTSESFRKK